jgi:hypothetical protein
MTYLVGPRSMTKRVCRSRQQALKLAEWLLKDNPTTEVRALKGDGSEETVFNPAAQIISKNPKTGKRGVRNKKK